MSIRRRIFLGIIVLFSVGFYFLIDLIGDDIEMRYRESTEEPLVDTSRVLASIASSSVVDGKINLPLFRKSFKHVHLQTFSAQIFGLLKNNVDLHLYMTDREGFVITNYKEIVDLTNVTNNHLGALLKKGIMEKRFERSKPGYKYKYAWTGKYPTKKMATMIINATFRTKAQVAEDLVDNENDEQIPPDSKFQGGEKSVQISEREPTALANSQYREESEQNLSDMYVKKVSETKAEVKAVPIEMNTMEKVEESFDSSINSPIEYKATGDHLFIRVNLKLFDIEEKTIIASIMKTLLGES